MATIIRIHKGPYDLEDLTFEFPDDLLVEKEESFKRLGLNVTRYTSEGWLVENVEDEWFVFQKKGEDDSPVLGDDEIQNEDGRVWGRVAGGGAWVLYYSAPEYLMVEEETIYIGVLLDYNLVEVV
jgi:hypothetical protein